MNAKSRVSKILRLATVPLSLGLAAAAPLVNGGFEEGLTGWSAAGNVAIQTNPPYLPTQGTSLVSFNALNSANGGSIQQQIDITGGRWHRLSFDVGNLSYNTQQQRMQVRVSEDLNGTIHTPLLEDVVIPGISGGNINWVSKEYVFTPLTHPITLSFTDTSTVTNALDLVLDHVKLSPSCSLLLKSTKNGLDVNAPIGLAPISIEGKTGGPTPNSAWYFEGTEITLSAPASLDGVPFRQWDDAGGMVSTSPTTTYTIRNDNSMTAVYGPDLGIDDHSLWEIKGFKGTGPFSPIIRSYQIHNHGEAPIQWAATAEISSPAGQVDCFEVFPSTGTLQAGDIATLRVVLTGRALELPAGEILAKLRLTGSGMVDESPISITVSDPASLLSNGGFEAGFSGWQVNGNVTLETDPVYVAHEGTQEATFNSLNSTPNGSLTKTFPTEPGVRYAIDFAIGTLSYNTNEQRLRVLVNDESETPLLDSVESIHGWGGGLCNWSPRHREFIATGNFTKVTFLDVSPGSNSIDLLLDRIVISNPGFEIVVTTANDENDTPPNFGAGTSLREAIAAASEGGGTHCIRFAESLNGSVLPLVGGQLECASSLAIDASNLTAGITLSPAGSSRIFDITGACSFKRLTLTNGNDSSEPTPGGGAIFNSGTLLMSDCTIKGSTSIESGGGIYSIGSLALLDCVIEDNHSDGVAGGIATRYGSSHVTRSTFSGNSAVNGGALTTQGAFGTAWLMISDCSIHGNSASSQGGAYSGIDGYKQSGTLYAINSTFANNSAVTSGGAIHGSRYVQLAHCTLTGNACSGAGASGGGIRFATLDSKYSIIAGNHADLDPEVSECLVIGDEANFFSGDPKLEDFGNGVSIPMVGSPVIDAAGVPIGIPTSDQRGKSRISGQAMDIGAVELQHRTVNTLVDENDGVNTGGVSLRDAVEAQATAPVEVIDFDPVLNGGTIVLGSMIGSFLHDVSIDAGSLADRIRISGNHQSGIFQFVWCRASLANLILEDSNTSAVVIADTYLELEDSVLRNNNSATSGGALKLIGALSTSAVIKDCFFDDNSALDSGGAISNEGVINIENSTFSNNQAGLSGGAISSGPYHSGLRLFNCTLSQNSSNGDGGAIHAGAASLVHSTISGNHAIAGQGGGIFSSSTAIFPDLGVTITNSIVAGNTATSDPDLSGLINASYGGNLVGGNPLLAPLADYGSGIPVMPPLPGSPAIEGAQWLDNTPLLDALAHPRPSGPLPDIGAVEAFAFSSLSPQDVDQDGIDDRIEPSYGMTVGSDDSGRDSDKDGSPDGEELANMTDPADSMSLMKITSFQPAADFDPLVNPAFDITFTSFPGMMYSIELNDHMDFKGEDTVTEPLGVALDFTTTRRITLRDGRDFVRVLRTP